MHHTNLLCIVVVASYQVLTISILPVAATCQSGSLASLIMSWPENQGNLFLYISQIFQMNRISFMVAQINAVLLIPLFHMRDQVRH